jgi:1-acyl-sn-glycerol-3-phosphate acyltransferase
MTGAPHVLMTERRLGFPNWMSSLRRHVVAGTVIATARVGTGLHARWVGCTPLPEQRIYFANHLSHGDFVLVWSALPPLLRAKTRPVAGADYWNKGRLRRFLAREVFNSVLIERGVTRARRDPLQPIRQALDQGSSLIVFPEGTRNATEETLLPFKSGIFYVASAYPAVPLVPVWIENTGRVMPKGEFLPIPLLCSATFGAPIHLEPGEPKGAFLDRTRNALLSLVPADGAAP